MSKPDEIKVLQKCFFDKYEMVVRFANEYIVQVPTVKDGLLLEMELNKFLRRWKTLAQLRRKP